MTTVTPPILFKTTTVEQQAKIIANYLPNGELFKAKNINESVYYLFLKGLAYTNKTVSDVINLFSAELDIASTQYLLQGWLDTLGLPDHCFPIDDTTSQATQRTYILTKLAGLGVQTADDFIAVAAIFGLTIECYSQASIPVSGDDAKFTIVIKYLDPYVYAFTYTFPIIFNALRDIDILLCFFETLRPANCRILYDNS